MIAETRSAALLGAFRGRPAADVAALARMSLCAVGFRRRQQRPHRRD
jgi:hypothetical protein